MQAGFEFAYLPASTSEDGDDSMESPGIIFQVFDNDDDNDDDNNDDDNNDDNDGDLDRVSFYSIGWPGTCYGEDTGLSI